jgi:CubicO group peptidase (beta-lactamase class C family)
MVPRDPDTARAAELAVDNVDGRVPGAALAVVRSGEPLLATCYGLADLEWRRPVTPTTVFRLASLSKPFLALTIMLLEQDGLLDLDAPIIEYLPDYPGHAGQVRVRHLLTHTSGIPNFVRQPGFAGTASRLDHTDAEVTARFAALPLQFEPGSRYAYSNSGYRLLDMIVAGVTGTAYADVLAERVLIPAGMYDTRVLSDEAIVPERAGGYQAGPDGFVNAPYLSMTIPGGAGGLGSTLQDLLRFDQALREETIAGDALQKRLFTPVRLSGGRTEDYGLGWAFNTYRGRRIVHHAGGIEGFSCIYLRIPDEDTSIIMLTNLGGHPCAPTARKLIDAVLKLSPPHYGPVNLPASTVNARAGTYTDPNELIEITAEQGQLVVRHAELTHRMAAIDSATYAAADDPDITLHFHDDEVEAACTLRYPIGWVTGYRTAPTVLR